MNIQLDELRFILHLFLWFIFGIFLTNDHEFIIYRRSVLERELASSHVPQEEQINQIKDLERKETEYIRLKRHKICVEDFDLLAIIGRGAFGEVEICSIRLHN